jgi:deazaflavin-dependent oxidoreductase (nitroreductase family)
MEREMKKVTDRQPPRGCARLLFRAPIYLYRIGLGGLLGGRFLLLSHIGRKSGLPRQAVVEVVHHDKARNTYIIASGFGEKSQWFQNLMHTPHVTIQVGRRKLAVTAERLSLAESGDEMVDYARRHPGAARNLARFMGFEVDGSEGDYRALGEEIPILALRPSKRSTLPEAAEH